jgi:Sec7-like guanine-nucleotide exchange factor
MEMFAAHYLRHNPSSPLVHDTCFVMAFAVIMLNTDAHNPVVISLEICLRKTCTNLKTINFFSQAIKNKMTKEEFITNNLRIGDDLSREFLEVNNTHRSDDMFYSHSLTHSQYDSSAYV